MARPEKVATVEEIRSKLESASAAVLTEYRGLKVGELAQLRASLRAADAEYKIFKNTLARRAAQEAGLADLIGLLDGPTAITFVRGDAVMVAKALRDYSKIHPALVVKGGILGTRVIRSDDVIALADIQPREVLLARIAGGLQAPLTKAAGLFQAFTRNMAYGLKALVDKRVAEGETLEDASAAATPSADVIEEAPSAAVVDGPPPAPAAAEPETPMTTDEAPAAAVVEPVAEAPAAAVGETVVEEPVAEASVALEETAAQEPATFEAPPADEPAADAAPAEAQTEAAPAAEAASPAAAAEVTADEAAAADAPAAEDQPEA
jgi:large subunit ribosomal protein L10